MKTINATNILCTISGVHDVSVKRERSVKCPRVNEIFVLLASSSGYTIFNIDSRRQTAVTAPIQKMAYFPFGSTTRRSPRLASATPPRASATIVTPVRKCLRTFVQVKQSGAEQALFELEELERYVRADHSYSSLSVEMVKADLGNNTLKSFLLITRKLKSYDEQLGP